jgi:hypothetical protein
MQALGCLSGVDRYIVKNDIAKNSVAIQGELMKEAQAAD